MRGVMLVNLGTPEAPTAAALRTYLAEFLGDPDVISAPSWLRYLLVKGFIVPFRSPRSASAYARIWTDQGSPLMVHSMALHRAVSDRLREECDVRLAMRYGSPSIASAVDGFAQAGVREILVLPLFPQEAGATTGSIEKEVARCVEGKGFTLTWVKSFFDQRGFIEAQAALVKGALEPAVDGATVVFSFHGLPVSHVQGRYPERCLRVDGCCDALTAVNANCYRAQCMRTARCLADGVGLQPGTWRVAFQSRLGPAAWIEPSLLPVLDELVDAGAKNIVVACPSFVSDCLETLEEVAIGAAEHVRARGGSLNVVACVNDSERWVEGVVEIIRGAV